VIHLFRHGRIPDYHTDQPLSPDGCQETLLTGRKLAEHIQAGETINFFSSPTRRTRQTAELLREGLNKALAERNVEATVGPVLVNDRLCNCQFILGGLTYDPIRPLFDVARWRLQETASVEYQACVTFQTEFWGSPDPMAYWLTHLSEAAEAPEAVAERTRAFLAERLAEGVGANSPQRDICIAHSANLRSFLRLVFGRDPGEPEFCGALTVSAGQVCYQGQTARFPLNGKLQ
jgi:broad specificity phosphatase PhoE